MAKIEKRKKKNDGELDLLKESSALLVVVEDAHSRGGDRELTGTAWK
jgi:hypothetical protein